MVVASPSQCDRFIVVNPVAHFTAMDKDSSLDSTLRNWRGEYASL
jgi:hypothetical protein